MFYASHSLLISESKHIIWSRDVLITGAGHHILKVRNVTKIQHVRVSYWSGIWAIWTFIVTQRMWL